MEIFGKQREIRILLLFCLPDMEMNPRVRFGCHTPFIYSLQKKTIMSFGLFAGMKQYKLTKANLDRNDPAVANSNSSVWAYPDLVPGIRLTNKKFFMDICFQQVSIFKQKGIGGQIGSPSKLLPHYSFSAGRKIKINDFNLPPSTLMGCTLFVA